MAVSSLSVIRADWDRRYEEMQLNDEGHEGKTVTTSIFIHIACLINSVSLHVCLCVQTFFSQDLSLVVRAASTVHDPGEKEKDAHFLPPSGMPVCPRGREIRGAS